MDAAAANVWTLSANDMMDDDVELVDEDALLDEEDLKKPDPASLRGEVGGLFSIAVIVVSDKCPGTSPLDQL